MVRAFLDVILQPLPCLGDRFHGVLLEIQNSSPQGIGFAHEEELREEHSGAFLPQVDSFLILIKPPLRLPAREKGNRQSLMLLGATSLMMMVSHISRKYCKCALVSSLGKS